MLTLEDLFREDGIKLHGSGDERDLLCPFHEDKTPSARVNLPKDLYFCHGCGAKGNAVTYLKEARRMTGREAKAYLEGQPTAPVSRPRTKPSRPTVFPSLPERNSAGAKKIRRSPLPRFKREAGVCRLPILELNREANEGRRRT